MWLRQRTVTISGSFGALQLSQHVRSTNKYCLTLMLKDQKATYGLLISEQRAFDVTININKTFLCQAAV